MHRDTVWEVLRRGPRERKRERMLVQASRLSLLAFVHFIIISWLAMVD